MAVKMRLFVILTVSIAPSANVIYNTTHPGCQSKKVQLFRHWALTLRLLSYIIVYNTQSVL